MTIIFWIIGILIFLVLMRGLIYEFSEIIGMIIGLAFLIGLVYIVFNFLTDIFTKVEPILANALAITIMIGIIYVIYRNIKSKL
ncbi:hypothetical protein N5S76_10960 [Aliarcobacter cryaerophilus]|uniref:hypothetical protein n=2 Tax=Aliarcobacter cryaerophilus TaxID=28198 RepID=UPI0021B51C52|nr:hypothetical protein [Aliarcobacter cryaerophilus]MCT7500299.1 hypothetical protein [Aliarcobacter cryaerophilus]MCT7544650.1 hypothetical protein [Aliarcobacter cryaerophilus]